MLQTQFPTNSAVHTGQDDAKGRPNTDDNNNKIAPVILAIDVGSSSVRCSAYRYEYTFTENANHKRAIHTIAVPGCSSSIQRQGVEPTTGTIRTKDLLNAIDTAVDEVLSKLSDQFEETKPWVSFRVDAVGFSTFVMNLVPIDDHGDLIENISISYACNASEVNSECQTLRHELGPNALDSLYQATGAPLHSAYALPQMRVLYRDNYIQSIHKWQSIASYCLSQWTSRKGLPISYSEASWTGLLNVHTCRYEESAIALLPPNCRQSLPDLADFTDYISGIPQYDMQTTSILNPYWTKWPQLRDTKFFLGIGDGACANIGSKCTSLSRIAVTVGTSAAARMCLRQEVSSSCNYSFFSIPKCKGLFCYRIDKNHLLLGGALTDGGSIVEWVSSFLNLDKDAFAECLGEIQVLVEAECGDETLKGSRDLVLAPFLSGERSTGFRDGAAGAVLGLTRGTTPAQFLKSCLEGVSLRLKAVLDLLLDVLRESNNPIAEDNEIATSKEGDVFSNPGLPLIVASGKAMEINHLWRQMIADSSGLSVVLDEDTNEGTSRGVARLVAIGLVGETKEGPIKTISSNCRTELSVLEDYEEELNPFLTSKPRPTATAVYAIKARAQDAFIEAVSPLFAHS